MSALALIALLIDAAIGWPDAAFRRIGHPVVWIGRIITALDDRLNTGDHRQAKGAIAVLLTVGAAVIPALIAQALLGYWIAAILAWPLVAARSLHDHVAAVMRPLRAGDLAAARHATSMIVGRDVTRADAPALTRAATESLAENASDGVIAPLFWAAVAGLPGIAAYKAINTLDSMIGHRTPRHEAFGWAAARLDDLVNLIPARLTALLFVMVAGKGWRVVLRDARRHRSPNAGWPEAAMAGALGVRLSGPRVYADRIAPEPWLNEGARDPDPEDLTRALRIYRRGVALMGLMLLTVAAVA
ncbi:adenosylcobinamide-phosphate synthase CbiB [Paracoccus sp. 1_MG-2023]|uniref:adenosylcobinamide-phosphate synthase CbiB n=1 Tax=unclassified Paracoccus (in: a-proteobacteria) TaxID=2688777 RepID=UPI001C088A59|nr:MULTISPECIES: adenosylcobinamide-phosphate synthase CbiB [unclassified Paracoccus (in: a-proteobacteria)]MBU2958733.1 adenosylcobinamide-phosphate synthase CbiB [Paracoccus sp. C2R09]MDO6667726.1 adenosylcobinamide-phosphate synthase CbiB [Paracoccus sp. 1_MG-2023]